jgi:hypothetical protein
MFKLILQVFLEEMINIWNVNNDAWQRTQQEFEDTKGR